MSAGYFVLFHSEGIVKAVTIPSTPKGFTFGGSTYQYCKHTDFNHLVRGSVLVGFQFLSPEDMGDEFLSASSFATLGMSFWIIGEAKHPFLRFISAAAKRQRLTKRQFLGDWCSPVVSKITFLLCPVSRGRTRSLVSSWRSVTSLLPLPIQ